MTSFGFLIWKFWKSVEVFSVISSCIFCIRKIIGNGVFLLPMSCIKFLLPFLPGKGTYVPTCTYVMLGLLLLASSWVNS